MDTTLCSYKHTCHRHLWRSSQQSIQKRTSGFVRYSSFVCDTSTEGKLLPSNRIYVVVTWSPRPHGGIVGQVGDVPYASPSPSSSLDTGVWIASMVMLTLLHLLMLAPPSAGVLAEFEPEPDPDPGPLTTR